MSKARSQSVENLTVKGKPEAVIPDFIEFVRGGVTVGVLPATFDFKDLDSSLHRLALQMIQQQRMRVALPW